MSTVRQHKRSYANYLGLLGGAPAAVPANTVLPVLTGTAQVGEILTTTDGTWTGNPAPVLSRQWKADDVAIVGSTGPTYAPVTGDIGKVITVSVTGVNYSGSATATSSATTAVIAAA